MKGLSSILKSFLIFCLLVGWQGSDAGCVVPGVLHSRRTPTAPRVNSHASVAYTCSAPYIHIYGSLTITCTDSENVFDKEPPVCGLPEYVLYVYEHARLFRGTLKGYRPLSRCLQACNDEPTCEAVDWGGGCWFHYSSSSCSTLGYLINVRHYQMKQCPDYQAYNCPCYPRGTCVKTYTSRSQVSVSSEQCVCNLGRTGDQCTGYVECSAPTIPNTAPLPASAVYRFTNTITYTCDSGYQLSDGSGSSFTLICGPRGKFEGERKSCIRTCDLPVGDHLRQVTQRTLTVEGQSATYTCDIGFQFNDTSTVKNLTCQADGTLDKRLPSCVPISCGFPSDKFNVKVVEGPYNYTQNVTFSCMPGYHFAGYVLNAPFTSECIATDTLQPSIPDCIKRTCTFPHLNNALTTFDSTNLFFMTSVEFKCMKGFQFSDGNTSVTLKCDENGGFGMDTLSCTTMLPVGGTRAASTDPKIVVSVGVGVTGAIVLILIVVIVVVFIKRKRKQCATSQPSKVVNADHSDTSELYQNSLSPPDSADGDNEYMLLEAKSMATVNRVAEYVNVTDSDYTVLRTAANETNRRHPKPANVDHCDNSELNKTSFSPPVSAVGDHEYVSLEDKTMSTVSNAAEYVNVNNSAYTALCMSANETIQQHPPAAGVGLYKNEV